MIEAYIQPYQIMVLLMHRRNQRVIWLFELAGRITNGNVKV